MLLLNLNLIRLIYLDASFNHIIRVFILNLFAFAEAILNLSFIYDLFFNDANAFIIIYIKLIIMMILSVICQIIDYFFFIMIKSNNPAY